MQYKYLVAFVPPEPYHGTLRQVMADLAPVSDALLPIPHVTLHRPITELSLEDIERIVASVALQMPQTRITLSGVYPFGRTHIVLPVQPTLTTACLWAELHRQFRQHPSYMHGTDDDDKTLHVTVGRAPSLRFDAAWEYAQQVRVPLEDLGAIPFQRITILRKATDGEGTWEVYRILPLAV